MPQKYWSLFRFDSGAGAWIPQTQIPRAGLDAFTRDKDSTITFIKLADGSEAKSSTETQSVWRDVTLTFPSVVMTSAVRSQLQTYVDNEWGIKIIVPISSGAKSYSEQVLKGYITNYKEEWPLGCDLTDGQEYKIIVTLHEFSVDGT